MRSLMTRGLISRLTMLTIALTTAGATGQSAGQDQIAIVEDARQAAQTGMYWAECRPTEIVASVEFRAGLVTRAEFANGYAHVGDESVVGAVPGRRSQHLDRPSS
jgi:hypothetical protein